MTAVAGTATATGDANQAICPVSTESSPGFRSYLPDCRAYELVSPPYKEGVALAGNEVEISGDGSRLVDRVTAAFAGSENDEGKGRETAYEFQRNEGAMRWETVALDPPASAFPHSDLQIPAGAGLTETLWSASTIAKPLEANLYREPVPASGTVPKLTLVGPERPSGSLAEGEEFSVVGASSNLTDIVTSLITPFTFEEERGINHSWHGDTTIPRQPSLYEYTGDANREPVLVGVSNKEVINGAPYINAGANLISQCGTLLGGTESGARETVDAYNAVSNTGEVVVFTAAHGPCKESGVVGSGPAVNEVYARIDGSETVGVSEPVLPTGEQCTEEPCLKAAQRSAVFQGASDDGKRIFFLTEQALLNSDKDGSMDLYMAELGRDSTGHAVVTRLIQVSHDSTNKEAAEVQGVVRVSEDGSHVYFVAKGVLSGANAEGRMPTKAADNLYAYNTGLNMTAFVGTLLTKEEEEELKPAEQVEEQKIEPIAEKVLIEVFENTGSVTEAYEAYYKVVAELTGTLGPGGTLAVDRSVWQEQDMRPVQASLPDGRFLVFLSSAHLTGSEDTSKVAQLFEYDAQQERLVRASVSEDGRDGNGNTYIAAKAPRIAAPRFLSSSPAAATSGLAVSKDGTVVFESADDLTAQAASGKTSVYEYRSADADIGNGTISLISDGQDVTTDPAGKSVVALFGLDATASDVFFATADSLVPQDTDTQLDVYDARVDGGFPPPPSEAGCIAEACRGPLSGAPSLPVLGGSTTQAGGDNVPRPASKPSRKARRLTRAQKRAMALRACHKKRNKRKRDACERRVKKRYGGKAEAKRSTGGRKS